MAIHLFGAYDEAQLICDECGEELIFFDKEEAVEFKKSSDWTSFRLKDGFLDLCPSCTELYKRRHG